MFEQLNDVINCKEEVDDLDMKYIINNLIKNGDAKLGNVPRLLLLLPFL